MHFGGEDDGEDDGVDAGDDDDGDDDDGARLAEQLQGLIGNIANQVGAQGGGPAPVVELRVRDNRLRELVMRRGGRAILRPGDIGSLVAGAGAPGGAGAARARGANNLAGGGILSDIFNLRNSLEEARRGAATSPASRRGGANSTSASMLRFTAG